jgi:hypothetical protein
MTTDLPNSLKLLCFQIHHSLLIAKAETEAEGEVADLDDLIATLENPTSSQDQLMAAISVAWEVCSGY